MRLVASASFGITWGWLQVILLRAQRKPAGYLACGLATLLVCLEPLEFFGWRETAIFATAGMAGALAHRGWLYQLWLARAS